jgi:outer membrane protein TolC
MKFIILFLISFPSYAVLSPSLVKETALKHHPTIIAAIEKLRATEEAIRGAKGAFDTRVISDYKRQTKDYYRNTVSRSFLVKPLPIANSKIYAGSEQISSLTGKFSPVYNTGNPSTTGQPGNYSVLGIQLSLWKNLLIDPNRANLKNARFNSIIAQSDKKLTELDIGRLAQLAYWEWVTARKIKAIYDELLKNGETRNEYLITRYKKGDIGQIIVTENEQYIASRKGSLQAATERLVRAEFAISLFYRNENTEPIVPTIDETYEDYPQNLSLFMDNLDLNGDIDLLIQKRPDIKNLTLQVQKSEVDLELARQDLKPQVDVTTEYFQRTKDDPTMPRDYLMVMAQVSVPIERNLGEGNIAAARARKIVAQSEMTLGKQTYKNEVMSLRQALRLRLEQVTQAEIEYTKAKELVATEAYKFKTGGGNLFLVNLREQTQANAEASFHESRLAFMDTLLTYQALTSTEE